MNKTVKILTSVLTSYFIYLVGEGVVKKCVM